MSLLFCLYYVLPSTLSSLSTEPLQSSVTKHKLCKINMKKMKRATVTQTQRCKACASLNLQPDLITVTHKHQRQTDHSQQSDCVWWFVCAFGRVRKVQSARMHEVIFCCQTLRVLETPILEVP